MPITSFAGKEARRKGRDLLLRLNCDGLELNSPGPPAACPQTLNSGDASPSSSAKVWGISIHNGNFLSLLLPNVIPGLTREVGVPFGGLHFHVGASFGLHGWNIARWEIGVLMGPT